VGDAISTAATRPTGSFLIASSAGVWSPRSRSVRVRLRP